MMGLKIEDESLESVSKENLIPNYYIPVSLVDALEEALRHLAGLDDDRPELPRHVHDVGLGRAHHPSQALLMQGNVTVMWPIHITLRRYFAHHFSFNSLVQRTHPAFCVSYAAKYETLKLRLYI